ncbi:MAG: uroporphyrinogen-III synthase [Oligoflexales bacterium]
MIIWTRSKSDWEKDQSLFSTLDNILHIPCIEKSHLSPPIPSPKGSLTVCTSPETAHIIPASDEKIICFGEKTFQTLSQKGHTDLEKIETTTAQGLLPYIQKNYQNFKSLWLPGPKNRAFDLSVFAKKNGWAFTVLDLYQTQTGCFAPRELIQKLHALPQGVLCFASPSSAQGFLKQPQSQDFLSWPVCVIGETTQVFCESQHFTKIYTAKNQSLKELYQCGLRTLQLQR